MATDRKQWGEKHRKTNLSSSRRRRGCKVLDKVKATVDFFHYIQHYVPQRWNTPSTLEPSHLMKLLTELRTAVYLYALAKPWPINLHHQIHYGLCTGPGLLRVSKQVRYEALPVYFQTNTFVLQAPLAVFDGLASWIERLTKLCGRKPFGGLQFQVHRCPWSDFPRVEKLIQLVVGGTFKPDTSAVDLTVPLARAGESQADRLFMTNDLQGGMYVQRAPEEAALIGEAACEQKRSTSKVSQQFEVLMALTMPLKSLEAYGEGKRLRREKAERNLREAKAEKKLLQNGKKKRMLMWTRKHSKRRRPFELVWR